MPANETGAKGQEVPFGTGRLENLEGVDADLVKDNREFVDERNVKVTLRVFDDFCRFGDLDATRALWMSFESCNPLARMSSFTILLPIQTRRTTNMASALPNGVTFPGRPPSLRQLRIRNSGNGRSRTWLERYLRTAYTST